MQYVLACVQRGLDLSNDDLHEEALSHEDACSLVGLAVTSMRDTQLLLEEVAFLLQFPLTYSALLSTVSKCTELSNTAALDNGNTDISTSLLEELARSAGHVPVTNVLWLHTTDRMESIHSRRLASRTRVRSGADGITSILIGSEVGSQNWTVDDLPVDDEPVPGTVLHPRFLGRGNEILGGVELIQTRNQDSSRRCKSRFLHLVSSCGSDALYAWNSSLPPGGVRWLPFGRDPAFNPKSGLFSMTAQQLGEEQFYNTSAGSSEVTVQGFPAAFFPRSVKGNPKFVVAFPVRC